MLKPPKCQWTSCNREMKLIRETEEFWCFVCGCGCVRAVSKPSTRDRSNYENYQKEAEKMRQMLNRPRTEYSFPKAIQ